MNTSNILIASVGGQGGLTLARVLAIAAIFDGYTTRTGETLGMAQRYGSVVSYVRIGPFVASPIFSHHEADYLLGLELSETIRNIHFLKVNGTLITADEYKPSYFMSISTPNITRAELIERIKKLKRDSIIVPARKIALEARNPRAINMVILGVFMSKSNILSLRSVEDAISEVLPSKVIESSVMAFRKGLIFGQQAL